MVSLKGLLAIIYMILHILVDNEPSVRSTLHGCHGSLKMSQSDLEHVHTAMIPWSLPFFLVSTIDPTTQSCQCRGSVPWK